MYTKRIFSIVSLIVAIAMLLTACGGAASVSKSDSNLTIAGVVFQDDQFMKSMVQG